MEREVEQYRPYLGLSPDEALARADTAPPAEKDRLNRFAGSAWGPIQMYFRFAPEDLAALRAGKELTFSTLPSWMGERPLPGELRQGVRLSQRDWRLIPQSNALIRDLTDPRGLPLTAVPHAHAMVRVRLIQSDLGQFALGGGPGVYCEAPLQYTFTGTRPYALGRSPAVLNPNNATANARFAREPALRSPVSLRPMMGGPWSPVHPERRSPRPEPALSPEPPAAAKKVTAADLLEGLHRATGRPIVADF
jgi:hypothetical protein